MLLRIESTGDRFKQHNLIASMFNFNASHRITWIVLGIGSVYYVFWNYKPNIKSNCNKFHNFIHSAQAQLNNIISKNMVCVCGWALASIHDTNEVKLSTNQFIFQWMHAIWIYLQWNEQFYKSTRNCAHTYIHTYTFISKWEFTANKCLFVVYWVHASVRMISNRATEKRNKIKHQANFNMNQAFMTM